MILPATVEERIIQQHRRTAANAAGWLFYQGFSPAKRALAWLINLVVPAAFTHDRRVIAELCLARTRHEVDDAISTLHRAPASDHAFIRGTMGCRVSGRRLAAVAGRLLERNQA